MKTTLFLAHDPGGYDVVFPLVKRFLSEGLTVEFYCAGPSAQLHSAYAASADQILDQVKQHLEKQSLQLLVTGTSWQSTTELEAIQCCKAAQIKTVSILDYWSNYLLRFTSPTQNQPIFPDHVILMDDLARSEAIADGIPDQLISVLGHPGLDGLLRSDHPNRQQHKSRKALFLSQPISLLYGTELGFTELEVLQDCLQALQNKQWELDVKLHPKDSDMQKAASFNRAVASEKKLREIVQAYDVVLGMNSMGLLYAVLLGVPSISYQPGLKQRDTCITNKLGLTHLLTSYAELVSELDTIQHKPQVMISDQIKELYLWLDGYSTDRIFRFLREVVTGEEV